MPAMTMKVAATKGYGGEVVLYDRYKEDREAIGRKLSQERGLTLVPTRLYFSGPRAKVEIALARGKDVGDKRRALKERDQKREIERALSDHARGH